MVYFLHRIVGVIIIRKVELSMDEEHKYEVIRSLADHETSNKHRAALVIGCTLRHINRMLKGYKEQGKSYFIHGNKGRKPVNKISLEVRNLVVNLYRTKYLNANFKHFTELLERNEDIKISESSVRKILEAEYIFSPKVTRAKRKRIKKQLEAMKSTAKTRKIAESIQTNLVAVEDAHSHRPRAAYFGELQQMDACPYEWIPEQIWHLHLAIDDARGNITGAYFDTQETLNGYYHVAYQMLTTYGIPYKILTDRRTVFVYKKKNSPSLDEDTYTQFAYACKQLGVELESTSVPQAKGRVERLNQTLQSRLPIELKLAGITTIDEANEFLASYIKEFNKKFALPLNNTTSVFVAAPEKEKINQILAVLTERKVDAGHCIRYAKKYYRMLNKEGEQEHYNKGTRVLVIRAFDKNLYCSVNNKDIYALEEIPVNEAKSKEFDPDYEPPKNKKQRILPANSTWQLKSFEHFVRIQEHHWHDDSWDSA